eukprot:g4876.t1 g4876   contig18:126012-127805(+)
MVSSTSTSTSASTVLSTKLWLFLLFVSYSLSLNNVDAQSLNDVKKQSVEGVASTNTWKKYKIFDNKQDRFGVGGAVSRAAAFVSSTATATTDDNDTINIKVKFGGNNTIGAETASQATPLVAALASSDSETKGLFRATAKAAKRGGGGTDDNEVKSSRSSKSKNGKSSKSSKNGKKQWSPTATELFFAGDPRSVGEGTTGNAVNAANTNEITLDVSAGSMYSLMVLSDGSTAAAGYIQDINEYKGHLGVVNRVEAANPLVTITDVVNLIGDAVVAPSFQKIYAGVETSPGSGLMHSVFIDVNGNVYAAGNNGNGQLCTGDTSSRDMPVQVLLPGQAVSAAVGADFTLILMATGDVYGCGSNQKGALGLGKSTTQTNSPMLVDGLKSVSSLSAGYDFAVFQTISGLFVTGANTFGQLCLDPSEYDDDIIFIPVLLLDLDIESFKAGYQSSYLLFDDGSVASCGRNDAGQLGDGSFDDSSRTVVSLSSDTRVIKLGVGPSAKSFFLIDSLKRVYAIGSNSNGQLGLGDMYDRNGPAWVNIAENISFISVGDTHSLFS